MKISFITEGVSGGTDTNTNLANDDLILTDALRDYQMSTGTELRFINNAGAEIMTMTNNSKLVEIGGSWKLPLVKGTTNQIPMETDGTGDVLFKSAISNGASFIIFSGSIGTLNGTNYGFFKKNGGGMYEVAGLGIGAANLVNLEMPVWDGVRKPVAYKMVAMRDAGEATGMSLNMYFDTPPTDTSIIFVQGSEIATNILGTNTANFQYFSGTIAASNFTGMRDGDFYTFGVQNLSEDMVNVRIWLTIYYDTSITF